MRGDFFDTNILLYVTSSDERKAERAEALIAQGGTISVQVLNEAANVARRKFGMNWDEVDSLLAPFKATLEVKDITSATHELGLSIGRRLSLSVHDAMLVASALQAGCRRFISEDLHHDLVVDGRIRVINPLLA